MDRRLERSTADDDPTHLRQPLRQPGNSGDEPLRCLLRDQPADEAEADILWRQAQTSAHLQPIDGRHRRDAVGHDVNFIGCNTQTDDVLAFRIRHGDDRPGHRPCQHDLDHPNVGSIVLIACDV